VVHAPPTVSAEIADPPVAAVMVTLFAAHAVVVVKKCAAQVMSNPERSFFIQPF
jgi:hypothetical protein